MAADFNPDGGYYAFDMPLRGNLTPYGLVDITIAMTDADHTMLSSEYQCPIQTYTGTLGAGRNIIAPTTPKGMWWVTNSTTGGFAITVKTSAGTGIAIASGKTALVRSDGVNVVRMTGDI